MSVFRSLKVNPSKKISLATLLSGLVSLSVVITLTILLIASYQSNKQSLLETTLSLNQSTAVKMSQTMDSLFKTMRSSLRYTADSLTKNDLLHQYKAQEYLELLRNSSNYFNSIAIVDETGLVLSVAPKSIGTAGQRISTETSLEALALKKPYISKPYTTPSTKRLIVMMSEPIFDQDGVYRGYIAGTIYLQENNVLNMIFASNNLEYSRSYFYVVGSNGQMMFQPDKSLVGKDVSQNPIVQKLLQGKSGQEQVVNSKGLTYLAGYAPVAENGWGIVVQSPIDVVYEQLYHHIRSIIFYTLLPFLLLLLGAIWLARRLAKPFGFLSDLVSKVGGGEKVHLPEVKQHWNREADLLTKTIMLAITDLQKQTDELTQAAMTDPLTGLMNRRTLEAIMNQWILEQTAFSIIVADIDRFKAINDTYGHQTGDEVLKLLAEIITLSVRPTDICCRYGGEEFVVLVSQASSEDAFFVAERIRQTLEASHQPFNGQVTVSLGIASFPAHSVSAESLFHIADQALYKAKHSGRNRTVIAALPE